MYAYIIRRLLTLIPVLLGLTLIVFLMIRAIPGNPAHIILGQAATEESIEALNKKLGLDQPWYVQYFKYLGGLLTGDLGDSIRTDSPISEQIWPYLAGTIELALVAMLIAVFIGVNAGIISAWFQNSWFDYALMLLALIGVSMPIFWLGLLEQWIFAVNLDWFPTGGRDNVRNPVEPITHLYIIDTIIQGDTEKLVEVIRHLVLPAVALATIPMAIIARITRSSMLEVMRTDYIRTAKAKGMKMFWVVYKHSLKNASIPILTVIGLQLGLLLGGAILTETIFSWPGIGRYIYDAINYRDYPVVQSSILIIALFFVLINLIVDILYAIIDPRIKYR
ncbi:ABC transporter permease [Fervidibacillus halotolerans]|uniref:ABC transporter permease n=1 Tax=Fervidibacillus halotolerans TaxID=2980027 RepID=A0A9E8RYH4_9BACI|nr:ABC transporter permease [Fervidibacillus halotolerans]WAA12243.1 ABC transporter permease [Fervidibacillus halotolerans]